MGLEELSDAQQKLLHPLIKLKRKSSQEALGNLAELVGDISRLYQDFAQGLRQLELKASNCSFITGICDPSSSEALRAIRGNVHQADSTVIAITKEQKGMLAVWTTLLSFLSRVQQETTEFASLLNNKVSDPLNTFFDQFKDGFSETVDQLQMDDVLNFIPNLRTLKQTPGFNHCGARKYVDNVLKAYKELQHSLENEKELIVEASGITRGKSQAKAVNKTVKAKISLGKYIHQLFEVAPDMKILITKGVSPETIEQLVNLKLKKSYSVTEEVTTDVVAFQDRFCKLEKRRLSIISSCLQMWVDAFVKYNRNSYNNLREVYQSIVEFSPESDYGQFEALIVGARVSHTSKHSRMPSEVWLPRNFTQLEDFKMKKQSNVCLILHQPVALDRYDDNATVIGNDVAPEPEPEDPFPQLIEEGDSEQHVPTDHGLNPPSMFGITCCNNRSESIQNVSGEPNLQEDVTPSTPAPLENTGEETAPTEECNLIETPKLPDEGCLEVEPPQDTSGDLQDMIPTTHAVQSETVDVQPETNVTHEQEPSIVASHIPVIDRKSHKKLDSMWTRSTTLLTGRKGGSHKRASSTQKTMEPHPPDSLNTRRKGKSSSRRSSSAAPSDLRDISMGKDDKRYKKETEGGSDKKQDKKEDKKKSRMDDRKSDGDKKRGSKREKAPVAVVVDGIQCDNGHFSKTPSEPPTNGIDFDFESFKTAREVLEETLRRSDEYFRGLNRYFHMSNNVSFNILDGDIKNYVNETEEHLKYPFEMKQLSATHVKASTSGQESSPSTKKMDTLSSVLPTNMSPIRPSHEDNLRRLLRLPYAFDDLRMDNHQWDLLALEQLVLLHRYISGFMTHPCLSNDSDATLRDFLLTNLGVIEHLVTRIRNFIEAFRNFIQTTRHEFEVIDILLTPRDTFVNTSPHISIHQMDIRYRLMLMIDSWHKNDVPLVGSLLFDLPEFHDFLYRQVVLVKLSMVQKLGRVVRRIPVLDGDLDKRWVEALESYDPNKVLNIKFKFEDNPKVDRMTNKILFILCECIGHLNYVRNIVEQRQWGEESVCDSNYMSARDQLIQVLNMTVQLEELDDELMGTLKVGHDGVPVSLDVTNRSTSSSSLVNPFKMTPEELKNIRNSKSAAVGMQPSRPRQDTVGSRDVPNIKLSDADDHFCTPMSIFEDEDIAILKKVKGKSGCFGRCGSWRARRRIDGDALVNPYFILPVDGTALSRCWKLEETIVLRLAACYHNIDSDRLRYGDWSMNFTTIEYAVYFMSTGCLLNFLLYKREQKDCYSNVCTLYHALLSANYMFIKKMVPEEFKVDAKHSKDNQIEIKTEHNDDDEGIKDIFAILQVPLNLAVLPKILGDIDVYLQLDMRGTSTSNIISSAKNGVPDYSSLQMTSFIDVDDVYERIAASKMQIAGMQLNRPSYKVHLLVLDSIRHNVPMLSLSKLSTSISLINASPTEQLVQCILMLRVITAEFRSIFSSQLMELNTENGSDDLGYRLSTFVLLYRLIYPNELDAVNTSTEASPLDVRSLFEVRDDNLNMDSFLRHVIIENAKSVVTSAFIKIDAFKLDDIDEFAATVIETIVSSIREHMTLASVWDEFLPAGDFPSLFTNACIHFFKRDIQYRISRPLDICKVMTSAHKLLLLQREIETSRLVKMPSDAQHDDLMQVLKFSFGHRGTSEDNLLTRHSDIMEVIGLSELEKKLASFKDIVSRAMNNEDWVRLGSQNHTQAVVDLATVLNATLKATLDLKVPFDNLLIPLTGSLEATMNHYFVSVTGGKISEQVTQVMSTLRDDPSANIEDTLKKLGDAFDLERGLFQMANLLYLGNYLSEVQDGLLQYCHRMLTERCEGSEELHKNLETDIHRDSSKFFKFDLDDLQGMNELALIPASKRLIQRQCEWHIQTLAQFYTLKTLHKMTVGLYQPTVTHGARVPDFLSTIKGLCTEFAKLGEASSKVLEAVFETIFCCVTYAIRASRWLPQEDSLLYDDLRALESLASGYQQDVSQLMTTASKHIE